MEGRSSGSGASMRGMVVVCPFWENSIAVAGDPVSCVNSSVIAGKSRKRQRSLVASHARAYSRWEGTSIASSPSLWMISQFSRRSSWK